MKQAALFLSHGSPMFALEPGTTGPALAAWAAAQPVPKAVLMMSPHWMTRSPVVMSNPQPKTWHDFGGFPPALYQLNYPAKGNTALANQVQGLLLSAGIDCASDAQRPFDHGAWVPMMHMFPKANIPMVQLSLPAYYKPEELVKLGKTLAVLREQGVMIIGSGSMTHNLGEFSHDRRMNQPAVPYVTEFARWVESALTRGDETALTNYRAIAPHAVRAHPTDEHFVTLFFALGAAAGDKLKYLSREVMLGSFAMDAVAFG